MRVFSLLSLAVIFLASCQTSSLQRRLAPTDSLLVQFFDENGNIYKAVTTTERTAIKKLVYFMGSGEEEKKDCPVNGRLLFYAKGAELERVSYGHSESCRQFHYGTKGSQTALPMGVGAATFLKALEEGSGYY